jgi:hypothetical protein
MQVRGIVMPDEERSRLGRPAGPGRRWSGAARLEVSKWLESARFLLVAGAILGGALVPALRLALAAYPPGSVFRVLVHQESDAFHWQKFQERRL